MLHLHGPIGQSCISGLFAIEEQKMQIRCTETLAWKGRACASLARANVDTFVLCWLGTSGVAHIAMDEVVPLNVQHNCWSSNCAVSQIYQTYLMRGL